MVGGDHQAEFDKHRENTEADLSPIEHFGVQVLTTGHWPTYKGVDLSLPPLLAKCTQVFKEFYDTKTSHRRLTCGSVAVCRLRQIRRAVSCPMFYLNFSKSMY